MSQKPHISVKGWEKFQHFGHGKERAATVTWIKLYVALLDDPEFCALGDSTKAHLVLLWALAARYHNRIPADLAFVEKKLPTTEPVVWEDLINGCWLEPCGITASALIATAWNRASGSASTEESRREEKKTASSARAREEITHLEGELRGLLPPEYHGDLDAALASPNVRVRVSAVGSIRAFGPGGAHPIRGATWDLVGRALREANANGGFEPRRLEVFLADLVRRANQPDDTLSPTQRSEQQLARERAAERIAS